MAKTTVYIALALGAQEPAYPAYVAFRSPFRFVSGATVVLPEPSPVALAEDGTGTVAVDPGIWLVDEILPTQVFRRAVVVPESAGIVQYSNLVEVTNPVELGYGPSWAAVAQQAALAAALARDEVLQQIQELAKGEPGGVATLDETGAVPEDQMPARLSPFSIYTIVGEQIDGRDIPGQIAAAIASYDIVIDAAAEAVSNEIIGRELVEAQYGFSSVAAGGFVGENGRGTDLLLDEEGRLIDPTLDRWAQRLLGKGLAASAELESDVAAGGFVGENGRGTDVLLDAQGRLTSGSLARIAPRLAPVIAPYLPSDGESNAIDLALSGSRNLRAPGGVAFVARADQLAAWGDSLTQGFPRPPFLEDRSNSWPGVFDAGWAGAVFNGGYGGQTADEIALHQGGYVLTVQGVTIPDAGSVVVAAEQIIAWRLDRLWSCVGSLAGVAGTLSRSGSTLTFTRDTPGAPVVVAAGTPYVSTLGEAHRESVQVIFAGRNDIGYASPAGDIVDRVIAATIAMVERPGVQHRRTLVVGTTTSTSETRGTTGHSHVTAINETLAQIYPNAWFDLRAYLIEQAIYDRGITPTATDLSRIDGDTLPPSIMEDGVHYSPATAALVAAQIRDQLDTRDWII